MDRAADYLIDFRGTLESISLLKLKGIFREMVTDQILEIYVNDPGTVKDIFKVLPSAIYELVEMEDNSGEYTICIKKTGKEKQKDS